MISGSLNGTEKSTATLLILWHTDQVRRTIVPHDRKKGKAAKQLYVQLSLNIHDNDNRFGLAGTSSALPILRHFCPSRQKVSPHDR